MPDRDVDDEDEVGFASAFASDPSLLRASFQGTSTSMKPLGIQQSPAFVPGRTPIPTRPIILRKISKLSTASLTQEQTTRLLRSLTQRDIAILQALHDYRYLTTLQIRQLFFPGIRSAQLRLEYLEDQGLLYRWKMFELPGMTRRPSLLLLTPRGARLLADVRGHRSLAYAQRATDARDHCWHVTHDLEANGFFIDLILASRLGPDEGLLLWIGEESCRSHRRSWAKEDRRPVATPDGAGVYLCRGQIIRFDLEWDRGTESIPRLTRKIRSYVGFYKNVRNADRYHVLFVLHHPRREEAVHGLVAAAPGFRRRRCRFWTTTVQRLEQHGPLGPLWCDAGERRNGDGWPPSEPRKPEELPRLRLSDLPPEDTSQRPIADCLGHAAWWERRPGGGEVA